MQRFRRRMRRLRRCWLSRRRKGLLAPILSPFGYSKRHLTQPSELTALLRKLHPVTTQFPLIRLGPEADGGYLLPDDFEGMPACFSPGVGRVSKFELDCANRGMRVFMADGTVDQPSIDHAAFSFERKNLGLMNSATSMTLDSWIDSARLPSDEDLLMQMDIEGSEWLALTNISMENLRRFRIIAVELHEFDSLFARSLFDFRARILERLLEDFVCVHLHPNNWRRERREHGISLPGTLEMTLHRRDRVQITGFRHDFPHRLDRDNGPQIPTLALSPSLFRQLNDLD